MIRTNRIIIFKQKGSARKESSGLPEQFLKWTGLMLPAMGLFFTAYSIYDTQYWKKAEFLSQHIEKFISSSPSRICVKILDYDSRPITLYADTVSVDLTEDEVAEALSIDTVRSDFKPIELKIREVFDEYLDGISAFNRYYKANLVSINDLKPFLRYQIQFMADPLARPKSRTLPPLQQAIWRYIDYYKFYDVKELCKEFSYDISVKGDRKEGT